MEDKREASAEVAASLHGAAHDQMKERRLFWHHIGSGGASAEGPALVSRLVQEFRCWGPDTYFRVCRLSVTAWLWTSGAVTTKECYVGGSADWPCHSSECGGRSSHVTAPLLLVNKIPYLASIFRYCYSSENIHSSGRIGRLLLIRDPWKGFNPEI